jgi:ABC-type ATPase involved in cell division
MSQVLVDIQNIPLKSAASKKDSTLSFSVSEGEFVLIEGGNGLGKSYLLNLMSGLSLPEAGRVLIRGLDSRTMTGAEKRDWRRSLGVVTAANSLLDQYSVEENLWLAAKALGVNEDNICRRTQEAMDLCGLTSVAAERVGRLSSGQKKRGMIARALVNRPQLILADDPWENLDSSFKKGLLNIFSQLPQFGYAIAFTVRSKSEVKVKAEKIISLGGTGC